MSNYLNGIVFTTLLVVVCVCVNKCVCPPVVPEASTEKPAAGAGHESVNETLEHDPVSWTA